MWKKKTPVLWKKKTHLVGDRSMWSEGLELPGRILYLKYSLFTTVVSRKSMHKTYNSTIEPTIAENHIGFYSCQSTEAIMDTGPWALSGALDLSLHYCKQCTAATWYAEWITAYSKWADVSVLLIKCKVSVCIHAVCGQKKLLYEVFFFFFFIYLISNIWSLSWSWSPLCHLFFYHYVYSKCHFV